MTTVEILKEMAFTATETQRRALEDAISVLSAEGDLISRQAVLDKFADYVGGGMSMNDFDALWDIVEKMPSVENKGEWIPNKHNDHFHCDKCGYDIDLIGGVASNFCPNCGADMRGE